ncbi:unnamed protein product [Linum trigynum]|uniref:BOI-related E3 ubiquitin-protein ligase 3 n=1 Tax=Linum trigynum TaxID=586398 RepID=A0AAV2CGX6_9ROSI
MAVQAQPYPETVGPGFFPMCGSQDWSPPANFTDDQSHRRIPCFGLPEQQQLAFQPPNNLFLHQQQQVPTSQTTPSTSTSTGGGSQSVLRSQLESQRQELDSFLQFQNERLRLALQEQRKRQLAVVLRGAEARVAAMVRRKEGELTQAATKRVELEARLRKAEAERDTWRRVAADTEAAALNLNRQLEHVKERMMCSTAAGFEGSDGDAESSASGGERWSSSPAARGGGCRRCETRGACVVLLPCRHLCSCKACEGFLGACPVCNSVKEGSLEVFWG